MKRFTIAFLVGAVSLLAVGQSQATQMNLTADPPDIQGGAIAMTYNSGTDAFAASGFTTLINDEFGDPDVYFLWTLDGVWTLDATITGAGQLTGGTLEAWGDISGSGPELLLSGALHTGFSGPGNAFGFVDSPAANYDTFEFLFDVDGGSLATQFGGIGAVGGVIMTAFFTESDQSFAGDWSTDFDNASSLGATADVFFVEAVPEPSSAVLVFLGLVLSAVSRHRANSFFQRKS